jgi:hypothetical protein
VEAVLHLTDDEFPEAMERIHAARNGRKMAAD